MSLIVTLHQLEQDNINLQGELNAEELDMENLDPLIVLRRPLFYDLEIQKDQENLLLQGKLKVSLDCQCARCLVRYVHDIQLDKWVCFVPLGGEERVQLINDSVDLTPYVREDIVLALPQHPDCGPDCKGITGNLRQSGESKVGERDVSSSPWNELDKLEL